MSTVMWNKTIWFDPSLFYCLCFIHSFPVIPFTGVKPLWNDELKDRVSLNIYFHPPVSGCITDCIPEKEDCLKPVGAMPFDYGGVFLSLRGVQFVVFWPPGQVRAFTPPLAQRAQPLCNQILCKTDCNWIEQSNPEWVVFIE